MDARCHIASAIGRLFHTCANTCSVMLYINWACSSTSAGNATAAALKLCRKDSMSVPANESDLPRISVVVPSYNQGHFLPEALDSIFRQEYPDLEVVVMDGGSTDDSLAVIQSNAHRLYYWQSEKDGGQSAAINAGVRHCTGDLVAWLNSDDLYWGNALWSIAHAYRAHPHHGLYIGNGLRYDQKTATYTPFCSRHVALDREALLHGTDYLLQPSVFFLRAAWNEVN